MTDSDQPVGNRVCYLLVLLKTWRSGICETPSQCPPYAPAMITCIVAIVNCPRGFKGGSIKAVCVSKKQHLYFPTLLGFCTLMISLYHIHFFNQVLIFCIRKMSMFHPGEQGHLLKKMLTWEDLTWHRHALLVKGRAHGIDSPQGLWTCNTFCLECYFLIFSHDFSPLAIQVSA